MHRVALAYFALLAAVITVANNHWLPQLAARIHEVPFCDKVLHFLLFGLLALVINLALIRRGGPVRRAIVIGSIAALIVATVEEYSNRFVAVRDPSLGDLAANYLGVLCLGVLPFCLRAWADRGAALPGVEPAQDVAGS